MGRVRVRNNRLPAIARRLEPEMDREVDRAGDDLANDVEQAVRFNTGETAASTKNYEPGELHATVGVGIRGGPAFYIRFWEFGWNNPNRYGIGPQAGDHTVQRTGLAFMPAFQSRMADAVRRAVR